MRRNVDKVTNEVVVLQDLVENFPMRQEKKKEVKNGGKDGKKKMKNYTEKILKRKRRIKKQ